MTENIPSVEVLPPEGNEPLTLAGYEVSPRQFLAFEVYCRTGKYKPAWEAAGVCKRTLLNWRRSPWWKAALQEYLREHQEKLAIYLSNRYEDIAEGFIGVVKGGPDATDKTANAKIQATKVFAELGDNPLINRRPDVRIQHNTFNSPGTLNMDKVAELSRLPGGHERILEIVSGSVAPPKEVLD